MEPIGRIVVLEDTNNDGKMDKRTVFADGLVLPRALKVLDRGVLVGEPPYAWLMHDTNGDLQHGHEGAGHRHLRSREARVEQNANGFHWGLDNWMHTANGDSILRLKDGKFEVQKSTARAANGASRTTTPAASTATRTNRRCTWTSCRRRTSCAIRTCCARAAATSRSGSRQRW